MHRQIAGKLTGPVTKWIVLVGVLLIAGGLGSFAGKLIDVQNNETQSWLPESAESTKAFDKLGAFQDEYDVGTTVVYYRDGGLTEADFSAIEEQAPEIEAIDADAITNVLTPAKAEAAGVPAPFVSDDGEVAKIEFTVNYGDKLWEELPDLKDEVDDITGLDDGGKVYLAGAGGQNADAATIFTSFDGKLLGVTLLAVILILLISYRSPLLWLLPIISAVVSLGTSMGLLYFLAKDAGLTVNGQTQFIMTVLVIGAGTDYALLLIARYREELRRHEDRHEAMAFALHRAAPAILASAATVAVGLLCLMFADLNSTAGLGPANAVAIVVTVLVMVTLLPALLVIFGRWMFWPFIPHFGSEEPTASGFWAKVGNSMVGRPRVVWIGTAAALAVACLGFFRLDTGGIPIDEQYTTDQDSVTGQAILVDHGLEDASTPIQVVANTDKAEDVAAAMRGVDGIAEPVIVGSKDGTTLIAANVLNDPYSEDAFAAVEDVRDAVHGVDGADALTTGLSAVTVDIMDASNRDNKVIIPIVLVAVLLILFGLLRSVVSPLLLIATVILSFGAALGMSGLVFEFIYGHENTDPGFPLWAFVFLVALGIDYNIFLMTRVREETINHGTRKGSLMALSSTGGVITSAGMVLAATFAMLATMPLTFTLQLGTTIALGVLLDTMIVRSVLVTAINLDLGGKIWWPSKIDTIDAPLDAVEEIIAAEDLRRLIDEAVMDASTVDLAFLDQATAQYQRRVGLLLDGEPWSERRATLLAITGSVLGLLGLSSLVRYDNGSVLSLVSGIGGLAAVMSSAVLFLLVARANARNEESLGKAHSALAGRLHETNIKYPGEVAYGVGIDVVRRLIQRRRLRQAIKVKKTLTRPGDGTATRTLETAGR